MTEKHTPVAYQNKRNGFIAKEDKNPEYNSPLYSAETVEQLEAENAALRKQVEELRHKLYEKESSNRSTPEPWPFIPNCD